MSSWQRTHTCGELTKDDVGASIVLNGWIENHRDHGGVLFIDIRDRYGVTQAVVREGSQADLLERAGRLGAEDVVSIVGDVSLRDADKVNSKRLTGEIEIVVRDLSILNEAETPPFEVLDDAEANEELRMRFRYLDLRRRPIAHALECRSKFVCSVRNCLAEQNFMDLETPILTKSTPEGARDYLVPSRVSPGRFYALPQSPQIFKQLLMVSGMDRYYQIARCFRDEDLRADRQPEFTQIDIEMSFVEEGDVLSLTEDLMIRGMSEGFGIELPRPFLRIDYEEALQRFGSDKPDTRFGMELTDVTEVAAQSSFKVFAGAVADGGIVKGLRVEGRADEFSRKDIDALATFVAEYGARGLAWAKVTAEGLTGPIARFYEGDDARVLLAPFGAVPGDLLLFVADTASTVHRALGELRVQLGNRLGLRDPTKHECCWVTGFPMFVRNEERGRWDSSHHPFTAPVDWDIEDFSQDTANIRSRAYDLCMNGWELGSGSVRIHRRDVQRRVFDFLGISEEEQEMKFGFLLEAFRYGAPPHGGIALGLDRIVTLALGLDSIRDVIAFPKTTSATDLMCDAPGVVAPEQLADLHIIAQPPDSSAPH